ncbi:MAG TPA: fumarylacetoacetate hydrolase family protein [Acidobacteriota bacterium]|nr:fumarylacetoacetate hydrolase family protein [Acidobacteriota bacterium]
MRLYKLRLASVVEQGSRLYSLPETGWDELLARDDLAQFLEDRIAAGCAESGFTFSPEDLLPPIGRQEVWAAGVTYFRSRSARMEEAKSAGGGSFYDRVYQAERPELFFKATAHRVAGSGQQVRIRSDSHWNVPEPELTLLVASSGRITGYTIGNDMSSRDIEGENPLYLPQAKIYDQCCALGPGILVTNDALDDTTEIDLVIARSGVTVFAGKTSLASMKRRPQVLVEYLFRECSFPHGCFLLTGTGIVPPETFTLQIGDEIRITIEPIGTLINYVR